MGEGSAVKERARAGDAASIQKEGSGSSDEKYVSGNTGRPVAKNFKRNTSDYFVMVGIAVACYYVGDWMSPGRTPEADCELLKDAFNPFQIDMEKQWVWWLVSGWMMMGAAIAVLVGLTFLFIQFCISPSEDRFNPSHFWTQIQTAWINICIMLPGVQQLVQVINYWGWTKVHYQFGELEAMDLNSMWVVARDMTLWMFLFEMAWYFQHRLMHDVKPLWHYGHAYHHQFKRPEHMIGLTNFAFDHVVEVWVTMSSAAFPTFFFAINLRVFQIISFAYMVLAVFVHWDGFFLRMHNNHHYLVTKNYGSHWPLFDMMFGTYHYDTMYHPYDKYNKAKAEAELKKGG